MKTLTLVVPCFNSAAYLHRCLDSLVQCGDDLEVLVVDDGSHDETGAIAEAYAERFPGTVRVIHQPNGGHGSAINTGLEHATGQYLKVVDSDDWLDVEALGRVLDSLRTMVADGADVDMVVSNFVYEKVDKRNKKAMRYRGVLPTGRVFSWDDVGQFGPSQYILMHSLIYRTDLLRECGLRLPEHTFYVDNLYAYVPLAHVERIVYLDEDLYRYFIGRSDQSVNESVMIGRVDQQLRINRMMIDHVGRVRRQPGISMGLCRYLIHYAEIVSAVSSVLLVRAGTVEARALKDGFWREVERDDPWLYRRLRRRSVLGQITNLPGRPGRGISMLAYRAAQWAVGFN
ncbi:glycosyltransferase family 2 protein [Pengzhenrongella frigida]|uniref:Glycosyltransferase family 2 protein n=1 Tax=Pengzhenrongella frigida TaxID=1259133 RepID=A0A4Q5N4E6_9MICO|nr:glycosyltransferase family 2 protein [Cellulomonas sp. HLT2-17]